MKAAKAASSYFERRSPSSRARESNTSFVSERATGGFSTKMHLPPSTQMAIATMSWMPQ